MTLLPDVQRELVRAAERRASAPSPRPARRPPWHTALLAAAITATVAGTAGAVLVETGVVGGEPSVPYPRVPGEERVGMERTSAPRVLGVVTVRGVGRVEVVGYRMRGYGGRGRLLCLDLVLPDRRTSGSCSPGPPPRVAGRTSTRLTRDDVGPDLILGSAATSVHSVVVRDRGSSDPGVTAQMIALAGPVARRLRVRPFKLYVAALASDRRRLTTVARAPDGEVIWQAPVR